MAGPCKVRRDCIDGRSIAQISVGGHRFDEVEASGIAAAVADGLAAANERGIVDRDVKPANDRTPSRPSRHR